MHVDDPSQSSPRLLAKIGRGCPDAGHIRIVDLTATTRTRGYTASQFNWPYSGKFDWPLTGLLRNGGVNAQELYVEGGWLVR